MLLEILLNYKKINWMRRRQFLQHTTFAASGMLMPGFIRQYVSSKATSRQNKILVIIQWSGGNDGLNTLIPLGQDPYYQFRPSLALHEEESILLQKDLGLHAALRPLAPDILGGGIHILNQVGYPNPDRSHFRSMDIWQSGSGSRETWSTGWLGRYLDHQCTSCSPYTALETGDALSLTLKGADRQGFVMENPDLLYRTASNPFLRALSRRKGIAEHSDLHYLYQVMQETHLAADVLHQAIESHPLTEAFPATALGRQLEIIARLILSDEDIHIFYASLDGFDTHANQKQAQANLFTQYAEAMQAFMTELKRHQLWSDTLVMTFSEFGRRVAENASRGTDHGAANQVWLAGGNLSGDPLRHAVPDLTRLVDGDLDYRIDFRSIYQELLTGWLHADSSAILGESFVPVPLFG